MHNASQTAYYWRHLTAGNPVGKPDLLECTDPGLCSQFDMDEMRTPKETPLELHGDGFGRNALNVRTP